MIRPIYLYGAEVLRKTAAPADLNDKEGIAALVQDLKDTLVVADGCGLAAPQIGVSTRVVIVDGDVVSDNYSYLKGFRALNTLEDPDKFGAWIRRIAHNRAVDHLRSTKPVMKWQPDFFQAE